MTFLIDEFWRYIFTHHCSLLQHCPNMKECQRVNCHHTFLADQADQEVQAALVDQVALADRVAQEDQADPTDQVSVVVDLSNH